MGRESEGREKKIIKKIFVYHLFFWGGGVQRKKRLLSLDKVATGGTLHFCATA